MDINTEDFKTLKSDDCDPITYFKWPIYQLPELLTSKETDRKSDKFFVHEQRENEFKVRVERVEISDKPCLEFSLFHDRRDCKEDIKIKVMHWLENSKEKKWKNEVQDEKLTFSKGERYQVHFNTHLTVKDLEEGGFFKDGLVVVCFEFHAWDDLVEKIESPKNALEWRKRLWSLSQQGLTGDIAMKVEGKELKIPKMILVASSDVFEQMLLEPKYKESQSGVIDICDTTFETMKIFLEYLHVGQIENFKQVCDDLLPLAHKYNVVQLQTDCFNEMLLNLTNENLFSRLKAAFLYGSEKLQIATIEYITCPNSSLTFEDIQKTEEWTQLDEKIKEEITEAVSDQNLFAKSNEEVLDKMEKWENEQEYFIPSFNKFMENNGELLFFKLSKSEEESEEEKLCV